MRIAIRRVVAIVLAVAISPAGGQDFTPGGLESAGLERIVPDTLAFDTEGRNALGNWEPFASVLGNSVFLVECNAYAEDATEPDTYQRYVLTFQAVRGGEPARGEAFFADDGAPYAGPINNYRQNGNPGRVAGDSRPGATAFLVGGEASPNELPQFRSDDRWDTGVVRAGRFATVQAYSLDPETLAQTMQCKAFDAISGRLTAGDPATDQISRFGGDMAALDDGNFAVVVEDRSRLHDPADKAVVAVIVGPDGSIVTDSFVVAPGEIWSNVAAHAVGFCVRVAGTLYFHANDGGVLGSVYQGDTAILDPIGNLITFDGSRGDGTRIASHINLPWVFLAGKAGEDIRIAAWDSRDFTYVAQANVNELTEANGGTDAHDFRAPFDRVNLAVDALGRVVVTWEVTISGTSTPQTAARVLAFDGEETTFSYLTPTFFPFESFSDGTATAGGPIRTIRPSPAMTTREICIAAKGEINLENDPSLGADSPTEVNFYTVFAHPDPQDDPTPPVGGGDLFRRGDINDDGNQDISDAVFMLGHLFLGGPRWICDPASDTNGDAKSDISDAVFLLGHLFLGGDPPPAPFPDCGKVPSEAGCPEASCNG